ncbi:hypothetical protein K449DRAFT_459958 [Hypoxylon sp. EC38]|nr:hypothetical protein K449DRAFT_459958 [Hypoxylon sp. EC38]
MTGESTRVYDLVLFGATGYTGRKCAEYIHTQLPPDIHWAVAGRNQEKLLSLVEKLTSLNASRTAPEIAELEDVVLLELTRKARVVISTVGPYQKYGEPIFKACATSGTHYLDCTGETPWVLEMIKKYEDTAKKTGAIMIPSSGFDCVPSDISTFAAVEYVRTHLHASTAQVDVALYAVEGSFSGGTLDSFMTAFDKYSLRQLFKIFAPYSLSPRTPVPNKKARRSGFAAKVFGLRYVRNLGWMSVSPQGPIDRCYVNRTWALNAMDPSTGYGNNFHFNAWVRMPGPLTAMAWHFAMVGALLLFSLRPARWLFRKVWFQPGQGPAPSSRKKEGFEYRTLAVADKDEAEAVITRLAFGRDPYSFTAMSLAQAALLLARDFDTQGFKVGGGILTSAYLGQQYVERLKSNGVEITTWKVVDH